MDLLAARSAVARAGTLCAGRSWDLARFSVLLQTPILQSVDRRESPFLHVGDRAKRRGWRGISIKLSGRSGIRVFSFFLAAANLWPRGGRTFQEEGGLKIAPAHQQGGTRTTRACHPAWREGPEALAIPLQVFIPRGKKSQRGG